MQRSSFLLLLLAFVGCASVEERKLIGRWTLDTDEMLDRRMGEDSRGGNSGLKDLAKSMAGHLSVRIEFDSDGSFRHNLSLLGSGGERRGRWRIAGRTEEGSLLQLSEDDFRSYDEWRVQFIERTRFEATIYGKSGTLTFKREQG
jgi:hypothetical protein